MRNPGIFSSSIPAAAKAHKLSHSSLPLLTSNTVTHTLTGPVERANRFSVWVWQVVYAHARVRDSRAKDHLTHTHTPVDMVRPFFIPPKTL